MQRRDALFVINQDASLRDLRAACYAGGIHSVVLLTTHRVFPLERKRVAQIAPDVEVISFADLLSEGDMCHCDEVAERLLLRGGSQGAGGYDSRFMALSVHEKNRIVHERLSALYEFRAVHYTPGLGVAASYWKDVGTALRIRKHTLEIIKGSIKRVVRRYLKPLYQVKTVTREVITPPERDVYVIREAGKAYTFLSQLKRLRVCPNTLVETGKFSTRSMKMLTASELPKSVVRQDGVPLSPGEHRSDNDHFFCMTIHDYDRAIAKALGQVLVFVDGYHPSNYPRSYLDSYGDDVFVVRTMFDEHWFKAYGKRTSKPPAFLEREYFASCETNRASRILVALNHAGDWTALINRSDTDDLVTAIANLAQRLPQLSFRIRTHPTMDHPAHEGMHSSDRIKSFVRSCNLANLHTSTVELADDLTWCDVCLSEYSQVLLDALRMGKIAVAVNLTKRRSFMQDYASLGFFHTANEEEALEMLQYFSGTPTDACHNQNGAVKRYNSLLADWLSGQP